MATQLAKKNDSIVVSALNARSNFGKLLRRIDVERRSVVIEKRGTPAAGLTGLWLPGLKSGPYRVVSDPR